MTVRVSVALAAMLALAPASESASFDIVIRGGTVYDGTGAPGRRADVGIRGDRIEAVGDLARSKARTVIDAKGLAVAPGFINMLSWATESLIADGRSQGDIRQGVTTEIFGEGSSMGPLTAEMKGRMRAEQGDVRFEVEWTTLAEYLAYLEKKGVAPNVASYIGAATVREYVVGQDDRAPTADEMERMRALVRREMEDGALGIGSSLIYAPGFYARTEELIELCKAAAPYKGKYISHMRSEGDRLLEAVEELIRIAGSGRARGDLPPEAAGSRTGRDGRRHARGRDGPPRGPARHRRQVPYVTAGATGFTACLPPAAMDGGYEALFRRIADPAERSKILAAMKAKPEGWENLCRAAGSPERLLLVEFKTEALKPLTGKTLAAVASMRGKDPDETILDLILEDRTRVGVVFFLMSEDNVRRQVRLPWVSSGPTPVLAPEACFLKSSALRAYGNFARLLGRYVRDEKL